MRLCFSSQHIIPVTLPGGVGTLALPVVYCAALRCITLHVLSLNKDSIAGVLNTEFVDMDMAV